jgi:hypothetical protein
MSLSLLRLAVLPLSLSLVACADEPAEPLSAAESAATTAAVEGMVVAISPITGTDLTSIAASFQASFGLGGLSCATVATNDTTFVDVTFNCTGLLSTSGALHIERVSPTSLEATAALTIGGIAINGALLVTVPASPTAERTFEGSLSIETPNRMLAAEAEASWRRVGPCVTYSASGNVVAEGPRGRAEGTIEIDDHTVCH